MKLFIPFVFLLFISSYSFAQYENFDLSNYKLPDMKRHQLDLEFKSYGSTRGRSTVDIYSSEPERIKTEINQFLANVELGYSYYGNSEKFQSTLATTFKTDYSFNNESDNDEYSYDYSDYTNYLSLNYDLKYFPGKKNWFVEVTPYTYFSFLNHNDKVDEEKSKYKDINSALGIGGGKGRIEQVQDSRHAILLLQEIEKRGVANKTLTDNEVYELSQLISQLKNKRIFDARKRKEEDLYAVDSFLVEKGVVDQNSGIKYFIGLEDIWRFGDLQIRESGKQFRTIIGPRYELREDIYSDYTNSLEVFSVNGMMDYTICNPISIKWQTDYDFGLAYTYSDKMVEEGISTSTSKHFSQIYLSANVGYFPNTRTSLHFIGGASLRNNSENDLFDEERYAFKFQFGSSAYYYISERLRLGGSVSYSGNLYGILNSDIENSSYTHFTYNLNFSYAIF